jgi:serine phosphatase RsbU (regulator of sigma subunit)
VHTLPKTIDSSVCDFLRGVPFFSNLGEDDLFRLVKIAVEIRLSKGVYLFEEGSIGRYFFIIQEGDLEILMRSGDQDILIAVRGIGEIIGELSLLDKMPRMASARAANDCKLLLFPREEFDRMLLNNPKVSRDLLYTILPRWRHTDTVIREHEQKFRSQSKELEKALVALQKTHSEQEKRVAERTTELQEQIRRYESIEQELRQQFNQLETLLQQRTDELEGAYNQLHTLQRRILQEQTAIRQMQRDVLPAACPPWPGLDVVCATEHAEGSGSDFYAHHVFKHTTGEKTFGESRYALAVGYGSGPGEMAALIMHVSLLSFQSLVAEAPTPAVLLGRLNQALAPYTRATHQHCALCCVYIEGGLLRVANAGGIMPLVCHQDGTATWVDVGGPPLGASSGLPLDYREVSCPLNRGDVLVLVSNGVLLACAGQDGESGTSRLEQAVVSGPRGQASALLDHLRFQVSHFLAGNHPHSDMTIAVVRR